jgi:hypothetical protein
MAPLGSVYIVDMNLDRKENENVGGDKTCTYLRTTNSQTITGKRRLRKPFGLKTKRFPVPSSRI